MSATHDLYRRVSLSRDLPLPYSAGAPQFLGDAGDVAMSLTLGVQSALDADELVSLRHPDDEQRREGADDSDDRDGFDCSPGHDQRSGS